MSMEIVLTFQEGVFKNYVATRDFTLGEPNNVKIRRGCELQYDGYTLVYQGEQYKTHKIRGTLNPSVGWVVPKEHYDPEARLDAMAAGIMVRKANGGNPSNVEMGKLLTTAQTEDRIVGTVGKHAAQTQLNNSRVYKSPQGNTSVDTGVVKEVRSGFKTSTRFSGVNVDNPDQFTEAIQNTDIKIDAPSDVIITAGSTEIEGFETDGVVVSSLNKTSNKPPMMKYGSPVVASASADKVSTSLQRKIALAVCPDFPENYDFAAPLKKRMARLRADFEDRPDVILAVAAAEMDPEMKAALITEFPEVFSG